jgi:hypothetical protein
MMGRVRRDVLVVLPLGDEAKGGGDAGVASVDHGEDALAAVAVVREEGAFGGREERHAPLLDDAVAGAPLLRRVAESRQAKVAPPLEVLPLL